MEDQYGPVTIWLLPFLKPAAVRHVFPDQEIGTNEEAVRTAVDHLDVDTGTRNVLVAHQFVTGAVRCESEEVSVGGLDQVGVSVFDPFDYVALGHIHGPQHVGRETVRDCGTPLTVISAGMGHTSERTTRVYLAQLDRSVIDKANRKIINL